MTHKYTLEEWRNEFVRRAGASDWKTLSWDQAKSVQFKCPACGEVYSIDDVFSVLGNMEEAAEKAPKYCIHRLKDDGKCDWVSWGLFCGPVFVTKPDGNKIYAFEFAGDAE